MSKIVKSTQSCSNGHLPNHVFILLLSARAHDMACEFACSVTMRSSNGANVLKVTPKYCIEHPYCARFSCNVCVKNVRDFHLYSIAKYIIS